jgi:single-stranded-DNA-specific exonuclease
VAKILVNRGIAAPAAVRRFLAPRFEHGKIPATPGLAEAVAVLSSARRSGSAVAVYGDYDVDGVAATTILRQALAAYGLRGPARPATCATGGGLFGAAEAETEPEIAFHIPRRTADGYGLNPAAVEHLAAEGVQVLVTVDCGISAAQEIDLANRLGMTVVVTDHHQPPTTLPAAAAIVNPWLNAAGGPAGCGLAGCDVDEPCGALVAFDLAQSLVAEVPDHWLDLAALATVADIVPLVGRNRDLVHDRLPQIPRTGNCGLSALLQVSGLTGKAVTARDLAFALAPRVNALGRLDLGEGARDAVRMFASRSASEALPIAEAMSLANVRRQQIEQSLTAKSLAMIEGGQTRAGEHGHLPAGLVVAGSGQEWHPGVVGIVASRLAARYWRPAAVVAVENGAGRGSVRGIPGYNIYQALVHCADLLDHFGGHAQAGGFGIDSSRLGDFAARFAQGIAQQGEIERETVIDAALTLAAIDEELVAELACLEPLGHGNPQPALASFGCEVLTARPIGAGKHLALTLRQAGTVREAVRFGLADGELEMCRPRAFVDVVFAPEINEWQDRRNLRLNLKAIRPARPCDG